MGLLLGCSTSRGVIRAGPGLVVPSRALNAALFVAARLSDALSTPIAETRKALQGGRGLHSGAERIIENRRRR